MKKLLFLLACTLYSATLFAQESTKIIKGNVLYLDTPLANAEVTIAGSGEIIKTKMDGKYEIKAKPGDILVFSYPSMRDMEIVVEDVTKILNLEMTPEVNQLDEVVVEKTVLKSQKELQAEYATNKNLINTAFGIIDKEVISYRLKILEGDDLPLGGVDFISSLQFRFPGLRVIRPADDFSRPIVYARSVSLSSLTPVVYDVDGMILTDAPTFIDVVNIHRIALINGVGAANKYGTIGSGGVLVINTKGGNFFSQRDGDGRPYDQAKLRNNTFENDALTTKETAKDVAGYLSALRNSTTEQGAIALYNEQITTYGNSFYYVLDAYDYFSSRWNSQNFADSIIADNYRLFRENPSALKSLAFMYQVQEKFESAHEIYKDVFILRPNYAQSYMDLANSYREVGDYQKSASIYARYGYLLEEGFLRAEGKLFTNIIDRELNNLVSLKGKEILSRKELKNFILDEEFNGTRLVFEWNDNEAEFEIQFVNPENQYFKSEHSLVADATRIKNEKLSGYSSEEYLIDDTLRGTWMVNVKYLGNKSLTPTYIKATVYHNYGSASQRKETKLFKMNLRNLNQQWFKVSNAGTIVSN
ncbi:carboxypeptidase-like regulatory domain-containing protein [Maribacter sp.]|nr:carboxypeptidase-like regulatory domain-containing protein [Maribacter sp.]